ncbi:hypothetical protein [Hydrogenophaga luteola]|uniref:Lipoprotein n=1 Tax=Hydrogenophaga luteola TaxID=1591122 RepID=A0ABV7W395_9BURK
MKKLLSFAAVLLVAVLGTGCATKTKMAFEDDGEKLSDKSKPVLLMTATIKNSYKPAYQPKVLVLHVERPGATDAKDRLNFVMDDKAKNESDDAAKGSQYFIRMELEPGSYDIKGMTSMARSFPVISSFFTPMHALLEVKGSGVIYLGHVEATVRERQGNEFKAGPSIPLLDQALSGASGGTFDVTITDALATDEALFKSRFPALKDAVITKQILPPFDRAKAQDWWEKN